MVQSHSASGKEEGGGVLGDESPRHNGCFGTFIGGIS